MSHLEILAAKPAPDELMALNWTVVADGFLNITNVTDFPANQNRYEIFIREEPPHTQSPLLIVDGVQANRINITIGNSVFINFARPTSQYMINSTGYYTNGSAVDGSVDISVWTSPLFFLNV